MLVAHAAPGQDCPARAPSQSRLSALKPTRPAHSLTRSAPGGLCSEGRRGTKPLTSRHSRAPRRPHYYPTVVLTISNIDTDSVHEGLHLRLCAITAARVDYQRA